MKLKISALLLVLCMVFGGCVPHSSVRHTAGCSEEGFQEHARCVHTRNLLNEQSFTTSTAQMQMQMREIEPNHDDEAAVEMIAAIVVAVLIICVVIYVCDSMDK